MTLRLLIWQLLFLVAVITNTGLLCFLLSVWQSYHCPVLGTSSLGDSTVIQNSPGTFDEKLHTRTDDCDTCTYLDGNTTGYIRRVESSVIFYTPNPKPLVIAKDISLGRYYAQRDLQGWTLAYNNFSFEVIEQSYRISIKLSDLSVFLCLGIATQDKHCIRPASYRLFNQGQRINQIHGLRDSLWRKDGMCYTLREALASYQGSHNFTFPCWVLPKDLESLKGAMLTDPRPYIVKPSAKGEGHGIFVVNSFDELATQYTDGFVVQPLLTDPYLINGKKFDFRTYVLMTSASPLRAYIFHEGLVRFASSKYNHSDAKKGKEQQVLTNTSIGKKYTQLSNLTWTFRRLKDHLTALKVDTEQLFQSLNEAIVRTLLSAEYRFLRDFHVSMGGYDCHNCFQLLGVDVIMDSQLNPYVIEVNGLPSMQLSHEIGARPNPSNPYTATKFGLLHDQLRILYNTSTLVAADLSNELQAINVGIKPGAFCNPKKHIICVDFKDMQKLVQSKQEFENKGNFIRIYPTPDGHKYSKQILHMHKLIKRKFSASGVKAPRTLWQTHYLYTALEQLYRST